MPKNKSKSRGVPLNVDIKYDGTIEDREQKWSNFVRSNIDDQIRKAQNSVGKVVSSPIVMENSKITSGDFPSLVNQTLRPGAKIFTPKIPDDEIQKALYEMDLIMEKELYEMQNKVEVAERDYSDEFEAAFECDSGWYIYCEKCGENRLQDKFDGQCKCRQCIVWERKVVYA